MQTPDIRITYVNKTGKDNFEVVVFTENVASDTPFVAWEVLKTPTSAAFVYPANVAVGATWFEAHGGITRYVGPFAASLGSTWQLTMSTAFDSPQLIEANLPPNPNGAIVERNMPPVAWSGQHFDFGLYKEGNLLVTQRNVGVGEEAVFQLTPYLYFGVVSEIQVGTTFKSLSITQANYRVDLQDYSSGLIISLSLSPAGEYTFTASSP